MKTKLCATVAFILAQLTIPNRVHAGGLVAAWGDDFDGQTTLPVGVNNVKAIAAGSWHNVALKADGTVVTWGFDGGSGLTNVPPGLKNVVAVSAGSDWSMALKADGTVSAWGAYDTDFHVSGLSSIKAIAAGWYHWLALKSDGTIATWGNGNDGYNPANPANIPSGLSNVVAVSAGIEFSVVLKSDGTVVAWGWDDYGQTNVPPGLSNIVAIAAGYYHALALKSDGTVVAWGLDSSGETDVPAGLSNVVAIAGGAYHSLALKADGTVVAWGSPDYGQLAVPQGLTNVVAIAAGGEHSLAIVPDGPVQITRDLQPSSQPLILHSNLTFSVSATGARPLSYRWYLNGQEWVPNGQALTNNSRVSGANTATLTIRDLQNTDMGTYTVVVSNAFGSVVSSGSTLTGPPFITWQSWTNLTVGAAAYVSLAVSAEGTPPLTYQWLFNGTNLMGPWTNSTWTNPPLTQNSYLYFDNVQSSNSGVYSWVVSNLYGSARADFSLVVTDRPPYIVTQPGSVSVPLGGKAAFAVSARGSSPLNYQWRFNGQDISEATNATLTLTNLAYDQTGYYDVVVSNPVGVVVSAKVWLNVGQTSVQVWSPSFRYAPMNVPPGLTNAVAIAAGAHQVLVLKRDGTVAAWSGAVPSPREPAVTNIPTGLDGVVAIAAGSYNNLDSSMVLRADGSVVVWTEVSYGPFWVTNLPVPATATNVVAIADGGDHYLALRSDGTVVVWGPNVDGYATPPNVTNPPAGLSNVVAVAAGNGYSLALRNDGTVAAWGSAGPATNVPAGLSNVIAISANWAGTCLALKADGTVTNWGNLLSGQPPGLSDVVAISADRYTAASLRSDGTVIPWNPYQYNFPPGVSNVIALACGGYPQPFWAYIVGDGSPFITIQPVSQTITDGGTVRFHARAVGAEQFPSYGSPGPYPPPRLLSYQWQFNGVDISNATNGDLTLTNVQGVSVGNYQVIVTNWLGSVTSRVAQLIIPYDGTLATALDATNLVWTTGPTNTPWFAEVSVTHDGVAAAQSGCISDNQQSTLETTVTGPGTVTFWWKVSSEEYFDFLSFFLDNSNAAAISGEVDWQQLSFSIPPGVHTLKWIYAKDPSVSVGQDAGWVDQVAFTPTVPLELSAPRLLLEGGFVFAASTTNGGVLQPGDLLGLEVQASTDLVNWTTLSGALTLTNGILEYQDPAAASAPLRFYRTVQNR